MDHEDSVKWRREYYGMLKELEISPFNIKQFGDILQIIKAEKTLKKDGKAVKIKKFFGRCDENEVGTLDFILEVKSSRRKHPYEISLKLFKYGNNDYVLKSYKESMNHSCEDTRYREHIQRREGPCYHQIMSAMFIERKSRKYIKRKGYDVEITKIYKRIPKRLMYLYDMLSKDRKIDSITLRKILFTYMKERKI